MIDLRTLTFMLTGFIFGLLANLPYWFWLHGGEWEWMNSLPLFVIGVGMQAMTTFFHELGHAAFMWFYGYVAMPTFDFTYGGGMAYAVTDQMTILLLGLYALIGYGLYLLRGEWPVQAILLAILVFNLATAFTDMHQVVIDFMGPGAQALVGGFCLYRTWLDLAPRGATERWLNAMIGSGLIINVLMEGWSLLHNSDYRDAYDAQKGGHGLGDFNKVADALSVGFDAPVVVWMGMAVLALIVPIGLYIINRPKEI
jgi:hypothetical protein